MAEKNTNRQFTLTDAVVFDMILFGGLLLLAIVSFNYNPRARSIPLVLSTIGSVMIFLQFLVDGFPNLRSKLPFVTEGGLLAGRRRSPKSEDDGSTGAGTGSRGAAYQSDESVESLKVWWRVFRLVLWLAGFIFMLGKMPYLIAVGGFVVLVTRIEAKESWKRSILLAMGVDAGFFVLFDLILKTQM